MIPILSLSTIYVVEVIKEDINLILNMVLFDSQILIKTIHSQINAS